MTLVLVVTALAVQWWPASRPEYRLACLAEPSHRPSRLPPPKYLGAGVAPLVALPVCGFAAAISALMVSGCLVWRWQRSRRSAARDREVTELLLALSVMIAELSVGAPPARACTAAARELDVGNVGSPVVGGLSTMAGRAELGGDIMPGIDGDDGPSWRRVGVAWQLADRHGLPMIELLESVRADLQARRQFAARTRAGLAGPRATAAVLAGLPILGVILGELMGAHPVTVLLGDGMGGLLLIIGTALSVAGLVWSERITDRAAGG